MARRLINKQGYSKDNLQVLLGGWTKWKELNALDPNKYPIASNTGDTGTPVSPATSVPATEEFPTIEPQGTPIP